MAQIMLIPYKLRIVPGKRPEQHPHGVTL